jgi:hypothetical protein
MNYAVGIEMLSGHIRYIHARRGAGSGRSPIDYQWSNVNGEIGWFPVIQAKIFRELLRGEKAFMISEHDFLISCVMES